MHRDGARGRPQKKAGETAAIAMARAVDPRRRPAKPPRARAPTTTREADFDSRRSMSARRSTTDRALMKPRAATPITRPSPRKPRIRHWKVNDADTASCSAALCVVASMPLSRRAASSASLWSRGPRRPAEP
jgi:hypothetical protein